MEFNKNIEKKIREKEKEQNNSDRGLLHTHIEVEEKQQGNQNY